MSVILSPEMVSTAQKLIEDAIFYMNLYLLDLMLFFEEFMLYFQEHRPIRIEIL